MCAKPTQANATIARMHMHACDCNRELEELVYVYIGTTFNATRIGRQRAGGHHVQVGGELHTCMQLAHSSSPAPHANQLPGWATMPLCHWAPAGVCMHTCTGMSFFRSRPRRVSRSTRAASIACGVVNSVHEPDASFPRCLALLDKKDSRYARVSQTRVNLVVFRGEPESKEVVWTLLADDARAALPNDFFVNGFLNVVDGHAFEFMHDCMCVACVRVCVCVCTRINRVVRGVTIDVLINVDHDHDRPCTCHCACKPCDGR